MLRIGETLRLTSAEIVNNFLAFMEKIDFNKVILIGHSMGDKVAKILALLHSDRIYGSVALDIAGLEKSVLINTFVKRCHVIE